MSSRGAEQSQPTERLVAIDSSKWLGDRTAEVHFERRSDGTLVMVECWTYGETIEGDLGNVTNEA